MSYNEKTTEELLKAGWYPGRKIDISDLVNLLESRGFAVSSQVTAFLEEFGMLELTQVHPSDKDYQWVHHTNPVKALGETGKKDYVDDGEEIAGEHLVIVGELYNRHEFIFLAESGKVYCEAGKKGDSIQEFWEKLLSTNEGAIPWWKLK